MDIRASLEMHRTAGSILLVINGRHTIFDSIRSVTSNITEDLRRRNVLFFESQNHKDTVNVIRPGIIELLQTLDAMAGSHTFSAILYSNHLRDPNDLSVSIEIEELLSVLIFIEMQFNRSPQRVRRNKSFEFEGVIFRDRYIAILKMIAPIDLYAKTIIVDHEGKWGTAKALRHPITRQLDPMYTRLQAVIVPVQPTPFSFRISRKERISRDVVRMRMDNDFMKMLCGSIHGFCRELPDGVNFVDQWIS